jgi:hypothetical protein
LDSYCGLPRCATRLIPFLKHFANNHAENVNGFWVFGCQDVPFRAGTLAENRIDCRIFFADNPQRKTESGIGGKNS